MGVGLRVPGGRALLRAWDEPGVLKAFNKCWLLLEGHGKF